MNASRISGRAPILLLTAILAVAGLAALLHPQGSGFDAVAEMRAQASLPAWPTSRRELRSWPRRFDSYVNDAFPGRAQLITAGNAALWRLGWLDSDRVIEGADGWLFLRRGQDTFEKSRGLDVLPDAEIKVWGERYVGVERQLAAQGATLWLAVIPDKQTAYPERIPAWARPAESGVRTTTDLILEELGRRGVNRVSDLREPLQEAGKHAAVFYRSDTHWNAAGAKVLAERLLPRMLGPADPELANLLRGLSVRETGQTFRGDLARMLGVPALPEERTSMLGIERARATYAPGMETIWTPADRVEAMAPGARPGTLLVLVDSFFDAIQPVLVELYERTVVVRHHGLTIPMEVVEKEKPAVVLVLIVERLLPPGGPRPR
jgi:alginate O-acetyltransferase complex protein AlgJ